MTIQSRKIAGILFIVFPTVAFGGFSLLRELIEIKSGYIDNPLRQDLWRAGHAHAGILLILSLVILKYIDETNLSENVKNWVRNAVPVTAIIIPAAFFLSVLNPESSQPSDIIYLAYVGFGILVFVFIVLGIGLLRNKLPEKY